MIGFIYALASSIFIAVANISAKEALRHEHSMEFSVFASIIAFFIMLPFAPWVSFEINYMYLGIIYLSAIFVAFGFFFLSRSLRHMDISVVVPLENVSIIFTAVFGIIVLGEWLSPSKFFGIGLIVAGAYLLEINHGHLDWKYPLREFYSSKYLHYLLLGSIAISIAAVFDRMILKEVDVLSFMFFSHIFLMANCLLIYIFLHKEPIRKAIAEARDSLGWALSFSISRLIASFIFAYAISLIYVSLAYSLKKMSTLISVILAGKIFHEDHIKWKIFASLLMVIGALFIVL